MLMREGECTSTIYGLIKNQEYKEAISILNQKLLIYSGSRATLSLLGYCYSQLQDFVNASDCYEQLTQLFPEIEEYKLYFAHSLYKADLFQAAIKVAVQIENPKFANSIIKLKAAIHYGENDLAGARNLVEQTLESDPESIINLGCIFYKEGDYEKAYLSFIQAIQTLGFQPTLVYNVALCYYQMRKYVNSLECISNIIDYGVKNYPELDVGMTTEGLEVRSVGNTIILHKTALIEAFNLKAAIEYNLKNYSAAFEALTDMPPRSEEELDHITLHNQALITMKENPASGFQKLQFLLQQETFPSETFANLLLLYIKYGYYNLAADVIAENVSLANTYLSPDLYDFIEAVLLRQSAPQDAYNRLDQMAAKQTEQLRRLTKLSKEASANHDAEQQLKTAQEYSDTLESYISVLMQQAKIYWDMENYQQVDKIFKKSVEFCSDDSIWKLNVAHVLFMQNKFKEANNIYKPIVKEQLNDMLLKMNPVILANFCVTCIMTNHNEDAEEVMHKIEEAEESLSYKDPDMKVFSLCIVNLVIGTLYCSKGNYDFGISRVIKSLEPYQKKLGLDTWFYAKRCILSLIENMVKHLILVSDSVLFDCIQFLEHCELYGHDIKTINEQPLDATKMHPGQNTVTFESRLLKSLLLEVIKT